MFKMFRYLNKYVGTYRVKAYYDLDLEDFPREENGAVMETFDDLYIPARLGLVKHSYREDRGQDILYWYTEKIKQGHNVYNILKEKYPDMWMETEEPGSEDYLIYFDANDIDKIDSVVELSRYGAGIRPYSDKNLPKPTYIIPEEDQNKLNNIVSGLDNTQKMIFMKNVLNDFDVKIQEKKGKRYNIEKSRRESKLKKKDFVHSIGMWNEFLKFVEENINGLQ